MGCRSAKDKQRREGAVSQRKTHVDDNEAVGRHPVEHPSSAGHTLSSGLEEGS